MSNVPPPAEASIRSKKDGVEEEASHNNSTMIQSSPLLPTPLGYVSYGCNTKGGDSPLGSSDHTSEVTSMTAPLPLTQEAASDMTTSSNNTTHISERKPRPLSFVTENPLSAVSSTVNISSIGNPMSSSLLALNGNSGSSGRLFSPVKIHSPLSFSAVLPSDSNNNSHKTSVAVGSPAVKVPSTISIIASSFDDEEKDEGVREETERIMMWEKEQGIGLDDDSDDEKDITQV